MKNIVDFEEFNSKFDHKSYIALGRELYLDLETPVSIFLKVSNGKNSFLLESIEGGETIGRYSFIGLGGYEKFALFDDNPINLITELLDINIIKPEWLERFFGGLVGYVSYDSVKYFDGIELPDNNGLDLPEACFLFVTDFLVYDHLKHKLYIVSYADCSKGSSREVYDLTYEKIDDIQNRLNSEKSKVYTKSSDTNEFNSKENISKNDFENNVKKIKKYIEEGEIIQAVFSRRISKKTSAHPFMIYRALRSVNPSPFMYYMDLDDHYVVGASPELLVQVEDQAITSVPIAGTRRRGDTVDEDIEIEHELLSDPKENAEHIMLLDLARNDVGRVSEPGSVEVVEYMDIKKFSHVMHIVSKVTGKKRKDVSALEVFKACFPAGTVSGAPKIRAMQIISDLENDKRGPYAGALGLFDFFGNIEVCITLRTLLIKNGIASVQSGGGIVYDSIPKLEFEEHLHKAQAVIKAIEIAEEEELPYI
jgi:anthranilate synthase component 1